MPARSIALLVVTSALAAAAIAPQSSNARLDTSAQTLVSRAAAYVAEYQTKFAFLVADEKYTQTVTRPDEPTLRRVMTGELFLTFLRTDRDWIAVHDVAEVDGTPVPDREKLQTLLQRADLVAVGRQIASRNAAYNIGSVGRNFNEPTLALMVLEAKHISRFRFDRGDVVDRDGVQLATLAFSERDAPTLIHGMTHKSVYSTGEFMIEAATGRIRSSMITFREDKVEATLRTDYVAENRLGLWVPATFAEQYELIKKGQTSELTKCVATYSNYRRFEATGRIK